MMSCCLLLCLALSGFESNSEGASSRHASSSPLSGSAHAQHISTITKKSMVLGMVVVVMMKNVRSKALDVAPCPGPKCPERAEGYGGNRRRK